MAQPKSNFTEHPDETLGLNSSGGSSKQLS
ncbi:hypothetical protein ABIB40_000135 [Pedobacter sp. UYP30]